MAGCLTLLRALARHGVPARPVDRAQGERPGVWVSAGEGLRCLLGLSSGPESSGGQLRKLLPYDLQVNTRIRYPSGEAGSTATALNKQQSKEGRTYILGCIGLLGVRQDPEKTPGLRDVGGVRLSDCGAHLVALSFTPPTHNVGESTC